MNSKLVCIVLASLVAASAMASADFMVTEAYTGVSGNDGTVDWFELTNLGSDAGTTAGLYYDDNSADPTKNYALPSFTVQPGESVIVLIEANTSDIGVFQNFWGTPVANVQVGITGGGSLSQSGDAVYVFDSNQPGANIVDSLIYSGSLAGQAATIEDITGQGPLTNSVLGVNGAYTSFGSSGVGRLIGSPGLVPEPASLLLLGIGGLILRRR